MQNANGNHSAERAERLKKVIFLDRDGVVNKDSPAYIKSWTEFEFLPGSLKAIREFTLKGFELIIITNQSAVNRNIITKDRLEFMHARLHRIVALNGGKIRDIFYCPHTPEEACACRKPKPGLIHRAREKYRIDLARSAMVGDSTKDIVCAKNAGCKFAVLVRTGNGIEAEKVLTEKGILADFVAQDLAAAAKWLMRSLS
jgi:D-glycero-D-manno-heptose 1,7-bisphosphate phosphatase